MEILQQLGNGFLSAMTLQNLIACFAGVLVGTIIGVLPGIGAVGATALLLPFSFGLPTSTSLVLLSGIYYGSMYGGSTTSILLNVPGEAASAITAIEGHKMAQKGRAGAALAVSAIGSFVAGTIGVILLMLFAPPLGDFALKFGPQEYLAIAVFGMVLLSNLTGGSFLESLLTFVLGMMITTIGIDPIMGNNRLSFGILDLSKGVEMLPVIMGLFGMAEVFSVAREPYEVGELIKIKFRDLYPTKKELKQSVPSIFRGSAIGFPIGLIPGPAAIMSSLISYKTEKGISRHKEDFGNGAIEGVAGPESANNAAAAGAMVPLLALGVPFAPATAVLLGGFMLQGVAPGPTFITEQAPLFWIIIASMYIGNVMLLILNLPLVGIFASLTKVQPKVLMPIVVAVMMIGAYSVNNSVFDLLILMIFGVIGYLLKIVKISPAPMVVGYVLGSVFEQGLRQSLIVAGGDYSTLFARPIAGTFYAICIATIAWVLISRIKRKPKVVFSDD